MLKRTGLLLLDLSFYFAFNGRFLLRDFTDAVCNEIDDIKASHALFLQEINSV